MVLVQGELPSGGIHNIRTDICRRDEGNDLEIETKSEAIMTALSGASTSRKSTHPDLAVERFGGPLGIIR